MNLVEARGPFDSTSAAGAMLMRQLGEPLLVGLILAGLGTSPLPALPVAIVVRSPRPAQQTTSGMSLTNVQRAGAAISELRRLTGFTWEQLARLFNVTRRSLHFWASGKTMTPTNEEHLQRLLGAIHKIDRGSAAANRAALLAVRGDGVIPFDLLAQGHYDTTVALLGQGVARTSFPTRSPDAKLARAPQRPEELVSALHDRVHREIGTSRPAKSVRTRGGR